MCPIPAVLSANGPNGIGAPPLSAEEGLSEANEARCGVGEAPEGFVGEAAKEDLSNRRRDRDRSHFRPNQKNETAPPISRIGAKYSLIT